MRSIDKLLEWAERNASTWGMDEIDEIVDNIEREVEELRDRDYRNGMEDGEMAAERDGWVRLPVDADGVPIRVGDVMELDSGAVEEVESMHYYGNGGWTTTTTHNTTAMPSIIRHHHAPTVEDVLREFYVYAERGKEHHREDVDDAVLAEYAARLMLAGEE